MILLVDRAEGKLDAKIDCRYDDRKEEKLVFIIVRTELKIILYIIFKRN